MKVGLGVLVALLLICAGSAGAAKGPSNKLLTYAGNTQFGRPFVLQVKRGIVIRMAIAWDASCVTSGALPFGGILERGTGPVPESVGPESGFLFFGGRLTKLGGFSGQGLGTTTVADSDGVVNQTISGRVKKNRANGRWRVTVDVIDPETSVADDSCKTSTFTWTAARSPKRAYGGFTNQDDPVVVQLNKARSTVSAFRIAWTAPCSDETSVSSSLTLTGLPVANRSFSTERTIDGVTGEDDTPVRYGVKLDGHIANTRATGTFQVSVTNPSAPSVTCASPTIEWNAAST
jgi:hypothetical protein